MCLVAISVPTILDLGANSSEHIPFFPGLVFGEQPSEPFKDEAVESAVHEPSSDRNWWSAGQEITMIGWIYGTASQKTVDAKDSVAFSVVLNRHNFTTNSVRAVTKEFAKKKKKKRRHARYDNRFRSLSLIQLFKGDKYPFKLT